jgi:hypothetical protein
MTAQHDPVDRVIDEAARQMTTSDPSVRFAAEVLTRIEQSDSESAGWWLLRSRLRIATAGALALAVVLLLVVSQQTVERPIPSEASRTVSTDTVAQDRRTFNAPTVQELAEPGVVAADQTPVLGASAARRRAFEPFPAVPPIEIGSIHLEPIEMAGIEVALLEISPIRINPVGIARQETP